MTETDLIVDRAQDAEREQSVIPRQDDATVMKVSMCTFVVQMVQNRDERQFQHPQNWESPIKKHKIQYRILTDFPANSQHKHP